MFYVIAEVFVELFNSVLDCAIEVHRMVLQHLDSSSEHFGLSLLLLACFMRLQDLNHSLGLQAKLAAKVIPGPLHTMQRLLREHLQGTMRNLPIFHWILLASVRLGLVGDDDLDVTFGPKGTAFK